MATALFTDTELICFDHDIITIIRNIKNQYQRPDINSIHKKIIKIPDFSDISKEFLNIGIENFLKNSRIRNKLNSCNPSFFLNNVEIPIHDDSHSVWHVEALSPEYSLTTPNNIPIASAIPETQELINNTVNYFSFTEVPSPDPSLVPSPKKKLQVPSYNPLVSPVSEHIVSHLKSPQVLENELFLDIMEKRMKFCKL